METTMSSPWYTSDYRYGTEPMPAAYLYAPQEMWGDMKSEVASGIPPTQRNATVNSDSVPSVSPVCAVSSGHGLRLGSAVPALGAPVAARTAAPAQGAPTGAEFQLREHMRKNMGAVMRYYARELASSDDRLQEELREAREEIQRLRERGTTRETRLSYVELQLKKCRIEGNHSGPRASNVGDLERVVVQQPTLLLPTGPVGFSGRPTAGSARVIRLTHEETDTLDIEDNRSHLSCEEI